MRHAELADKQCAVARTWAVIGERWTMMILRECFRGVKRFEDIQAKLQLGRNISPSGCSCSSTRTSSSAGRTSRTPSATSTS